MNLLIAITDAKIIKIIKNSFQESIMNKNIEYQEGIIEVLEKNSKINLIIISSDLPGEIGLEKLIKKIKKINIKIKILILDEKNNPKNYFENEKNIEKIKKKNFNINKIIEMLKIKKNNNIIIQILGNRGSGKTIFTYIISELFLNKGKKILIIDDDSKNNSLSKMYLNKKNINEIEKVKDKLFLLNIKKLNGKIKENKKINNYIKEKSNFFDLTIIDSTNNILKYKEIINTYIYLIEPNLIELKKINNIISNKKIHLILNKTNIYSINKNIIKRILKKTNIEEIKYSKKINKIINEKNINILNNKEKNNFYKIFYNIIRR